VEHEGRGPDGCRRRGLPAIFPLVIYHGEAEWRIPLDFASGIDLADDALRPHLLNFRYSLADLGRIDDARLSREKRLRIGLLILKRGSGDGDLRETLLALGRAALSIGFDDLVALVHYILLESNEVEAAVLRDVLNTNNNHREAVQYERLIAAAEKMPQAERKAIVDSNTDVLKGRQQAIVHAKEAALWAGEAEALRLYIMARSRIGEAVTAAGTEQAEE
jgi:hypothetical protein